MSINNLINGISLGSLYGLIAVGIILIYRTNRIINFAAAAVGAVPAIFALLLDVQRHISYLVVLPIALIGGPLLAGWSTSVVMRRFAKSPRLIATVVTLGVAQGFAALGFFIPIWIGARAGQISLVPTPWDGAVERQPRQPDHHRQPDRRDPGDRSRSRSAWRCSCATPASASPCARRPRTPTVPRCSASRSSACRRPRGCSPDSSASMAIFFQSPLIGVPNNATLGFDSLLYARRRGRRADGAHRCRARRRHVRRHHRVRRRVADGQEQPSSARTCSW